MNEDANPYEEHEENLELLLQEVLEEQARLSVILEESKVAESLEQEAFLERLEAKLQGTANRKSPSNLALLLTLLALIVGSSIYSLNKSYQLHKEWQKQIDKKMQTAIELDQVILFFEELKEKENARQSNKSTDGR